MKVLVFGTFDGLHPGHQFVLTEASKRGEFYVVIARDVNVKKIKGRTPSQSEEGRRSKVEKTFPDAHVVLGNPSGDFMEPVREIKPDLILLGYDQKLPPGVREQDFKCSVERLPPFEAEKWKSSLLRK